MIQALQEVVFKRTGIPVDEQHTQLSFPASLYQINQNDEQSELEFSDFDEVLFEGNYVISVFNERTYNSEGIPLPVYDNSYVSNMHTDVSYTDIVTIFEEFVSKMEMQAYGNVLAGVRITESLGNSSVLEIQIHFE